MANLSNVFGGQGFDASQVDPAQVYELLPPGKYIAQIVSSEMKDTKDGSGQFLALKLQIIGGEEDGRAIFDNLNLVNQNQQTMEIAQRTLSAICHAIGRLNIEDSEQLHFQEMEINVAVEVDKRDEGLPVAERRRQNRIRGYAPAPGATPGQQQMPMQRQSGGAPGASAARQGPPQQQGRQGPPPAAARSAPQQSGQAASPAAARGAPGAAAPWRR